MYGTMAYAIAVNVDDAQAVFKRAIAFDGVAFEQFVPEGQIKIPAIRGVGGGIIYFIDNKSVLKDFVIKDFDLVTHDEEVSFEETVIKDAWLLRIDHIAQTIDFDEMLGWVLFYTSIFDVQKNRY